jgi:TolB-like protein/DNA-binding winged helix-turn-helix (wHTH) protein/Flp pilus assembly protein TadD
MTEANQPPRRLRFGVFEADIRTGELTKLGKRVRLQEQPFQLLAFLLDKPGQLVTREELRDKLWPQTIIDFDHGLNKAISKIREALGDSAENPRFIETIARRGYRFLADVSAVDEEEAESVNDEQSVTAAPRFTPVGIFPKQSYRVFRWFSPVVLALLLGYITWSFYPRKQVLPSIQSLAVLPLKNLSDDASQEYLADGMTDELINYLGQIKNLRVISRTSAMTYKDERKPLATIGRELNVEAVVEGSVFRSGDRVRITAQLIQVPADTQIWAQSYEGNMGETLALQSKVAHSIAEKIQGTLTPREEATPERSKVVDPNAHELYLKGRYFWNKRTGDGLKKAIAYFRQAIELNPASAEAYAGLADAYALSGDWEYGIFSPQVAFSEAKTAAAKALALDNKLSEAHTSLAFALDLYGWDWKAAEAEYKLAIELNPNYATAHQWYAWHLILMGQNREGVSELRKAESLDPLSLIVSADLADALCIANLLEEAIQQSKKTLELDQHFAVAHYELGQALEQKQRLDEAISEFQKAIEISGHSAVLDSSLAHAYAISGHREEATRIANDLESQNDKNPSAEANIALIYVGLGDKDQAMMWLNKAYYARFNPSILVRPAFDPVRSDPRFKDLSRRIGLPN